METVGALFPFVLILGAFYLLIIRPARSRARAAQALQQQLSPGLEVMTTSGIFGRVVAVEEDRVAVEISPGTSVQFAKAAVARIVTAEDQGAETPAEGDRPESDQPPR